MNEEEQLVVVHGVRLVPYNNMERRITHPFRIRSASLVRFAMVTKDVAMPMHTSDA